MSPRSRLYLLLSLFALLFSNMGWAAAHYSATQMQTVQAALSTAFTYQGQLTSTGAPVSGNCDMAFRLYDDVAAGAQIGAAITTTVPVSGGVFTTQLDFGSGVFNGDARWLGIAVKCGSDSGFTTIAPRHALTAVPEAINAQTLGGLDASGYQPRMNATWIQQSPRNTPPDARYDAGNAYDAINDRLIVFGGEDLTSLPRPTDVWVLANASGVVGTSSWTQLSPTGGPPLGRDFGTVIYDPTSNSIIVHGGCAGNCSPALADTWVLSNANGLSGTPTWTQLPDAPVARDEHGAVYDSGSNRMIVFGGNTGFYGTDRNDVWVLIDANGIGSPSWIQLTPSGTPPAPRRSMGTIYDPTTNRLIILEGYQALSSTDNTYYNDIWVLTNANGLGGTPQWIQLTPTGTLPADRGGVSLVYDPATNRSILFGGVFQPDGGTPIYTFYNDVWVLTEANGVGGSPQWIQITLNGTLPVARFGSSVGYSTSSNRLIVALGRLVGDVPTNEVWLLTSANGLTR